MERKNFKYESLRGLKYFSSKITVEDALRLIESKNGNLMPEHSANNKTYLLNDRSVVQMIGGAGKLYPTYTDFFVMTAIERMQYPLASPCKKILKGFPKPRMVRYAEDGIAEYWEISRQHASRLIDLKSPPDFKYPRIYARYQVPGGKFLLASIFESDPFYGLFKNESDCDQFVKLSYMLLEYEWNDSSPYLLGRNPYGQHFPEHIPGLIQQLGELLDLPPEDLQLTLKNFNHLQNTLRTYTFTDHFADVLYLPLLAWLGAFQIENIGGSWLMEYNSKYGFWTPLIEVEGAKHNIAGRVFTIVYPNWEEFQPFTQALFTHTDDGRKRFQDLMDRYRQENPPVDSGRRIPLD